MALYLYGDPAYSTVYGTSKRPPRERELISNQAKKVAVVNMIFIAFLNKLLLAYYTPFPIPCCSLFFVRDLMGWKSNRLME